MPKSLFDKVWEAHEVLPGSGDHPGILYIDLHLIHEVTSPQAFDVLRQRGLKVRRPDRTLATMDHSTPTLPPDEHGRRPYVSEAAQKQVEQLQANCAEFGIELHDFSSPSRGIVHVMAPELGAVHPGMTVVCGDSHTSTHGAFGALAFGIGTSEVGHVLATQCLLQNKPKSMLIQLRGRPGPGTGAKDLILAIIGQIGIHGGTGHVIEYRGQAISDLDMEGRMTLCNMSIEAGARAGMIAPDERTLAWLKNRPRSPQGPAWDAACERWLSLASDPDAHFDTVVEVDVEGLKPQITWGTHPGMEGDIDLRLPQEQDPDTRKAMDYMGEQPGQPMLGRKVDVVFVGSCTNARLSDLREAAAILRGRKVAEHVRMLVVPGSEQVRRQAEAEGLDQVFLQAGAQWREPGCSMCIAMNGDRAGPGELAVSTSNRNFEGRQGQGSRTVLASPATAAASAVRGCIADPREFL